jgi:hypothetical protein
MLDLGGGSLTRLAESRVDFARLLDVRNNSRDWFAYFAQGRPAIHGMTVHGFTPCRSNAHEAGRAELSIRDEHSSIV